jgi:hypothetical protein
MFQGLGLDLLGSWQVPVTGSCDHSTERLGSINGEDFSSVDLKVRFLKDSTLWSYVTET